MTSNMVCICYVFNDREMKIKNNLFQTADSFSTL